jgi:hypothetical protein
METVARRVAETKAIIARAVEEAAAAQEQWPGTKEAAAREQRREQREERRLARQREVQRELRRNVTVRSKRASPMVDEVEVDQDGQQPHSKRRKSARSEALHTEAHATTECGICLRDIRESRTNELVCGHAFCTGCIAQWAVSRAANRRRCPTCRKDMGQQGN